MSSKFKKKNCIYCGKPTTSKDHVPPKCFFPKPVPKNLITVPACFDCNESFSADENYTRIILASAKISDQPGSSAEKIWNQKVQRSLQKNSKVLKEIYISFRFVDIYHGPIYLGKRPAFPCDRKRIDRIIGKIVKGLFYFENKKPLSNDFTVKILWSPYKGNKILHEIINALHVSNIKQIGEGVFKYRNIYAKEDLNWSTWELNFYNSYLSFIGITGKELKNNDIDKI